MEKYVMYCKYEKDETMYYVGMFENAVEAIRKQIELYGEYEIEKVWINIA